MRRLNLDISELNDCQNDHGLLVEGTCNPTTPARVDSAKQPETHANSVAAHREPNLPLVIDLDGTLIKTDSLHETFLDVMRVNPAALWKLPIKLYAGRAAVKHFLASQCAPSVDTWPVRQDFIDYVRGQSQAGRRVVLATAANQATADAVAARFPFISDVMASNQTCNLKGRAKALRLRERFPGGFIYAGDSSEDIAIWEQGAGSILVNVSQRIASRALQVSHPLAVFPRRGLTISSLCRGLRLHQWAKNLLVFIPLLLGGKAGDSWAWISALTGFIALGLAASATYIINDLWDLPNDRRHWTKHARPLASGDMSIRTGIFLALAGLMVAFGAIALMGLAPLALLAAYVAVSLSYSFMLKRIPVLDVFILASLFTLRLGFGIMLADVRLSPWLLVFSMFVFLSLSLGKRHSELLRVVKNGLEAIPGRGYLVSDTPLTLGIGLASMLSSVFIMVLYLIEDAFPRQLYANPVWLWTIPPILFLFLGRIWLVAQRGELHDDPVAFALRDRPSLILGVLMATSFAAALGTDSLANAANFLFPA